MKGLFAWVGFKTKAIPYERQPRYAGRTKWNYISLFNLSLEGITGFSLAPLKLATFTGVMISIFSFIFGITILLRTLLYGNEVPGYPSLMVMITFLSGVQLITIGILGEYVGRIFNEVKNRPLYIIDEFQD
jgi:glycosyltransferase involved in cell wall biosynthesis